MCGWLYDRALDLIDPEGPLATKEQRAYFGAKTAGREGVVGASEGLSPEKTPITGAKAAAISGAGVLALIAFLVLVARGSGEVPAFLLFIVGIALSVAGVWLYLFDRFPTATLLGTAALLYSTKKKRPSA